MFHTLQKSLPQNVLPAHRSYSFQFSSCRSFLLELYSLCKPGMWIKD